ncbi:MAG: NAD(P)H-binding protein, partial [Marinifilaceae bacterium]|nr:NAD(P)H-binding protein [Marinifilaceae bacterium]
MNIFLFGATGGTGYEVLVKLLEEKYHVVALARNPIALDHIKRMHSNLKIVKGTIYNTETYQEELNKCAIVISTLGTGTSRKPTEIYSKGGQHIISAMRMANLKRL